MKLVILDAHALIHRAYHALPPLSQKGEPTNALYGFFSSFIKMSGELKPDYLIAAFDTPELTFRHKEFKDYKAHRPKAPDDLVKQIVSVRKAVEEIGIYALEKPGYEADDVIGTITSQLKSKVEELEIIIVTGDLDTLQLVRDGVKVYTMKRGISDTVVYDEKAVKERFSLKPEQLSDYKGLVGDASDNIPGIKGIGPKTAVTLLRQFGSIENMYKHIEEVENQALRQKLLTQKEEAFFSKELGTINCDVPLKFDLANARWKGMPLERAQQLFHSLGFHTLINRLSQQKGGNSAQASLFSRAAEKTFVPSPSNSGEARKRQVALWLLDPSKASIQSDETMALLYERLQSKGLLDVFLQIEVPLIGVLEAMEAKGIKVDKKALGLLETDLGKEVRSRKQEIIRLAGEDFNPNSSDQLRTLLFEKLQLSSKGLKKTPGGKISTRESELLKIADRHELLPIILHYRELEKLLTTYVRPLLQKVEKDGRVHTSFSQAGTSTGRLSSQNPNLQNIPTQGEWAKRVKNIFLAQKGYMLVSFDYAQIELRVAAHLANDEDLIAAFARGEDVHTHTASEVFEVSSQNVTPAMRRMAKVFNFGILYGLSAHGLSESLGVSLKEAQEFIDGYFARFRGIKRYIDELKGEVSTKGYVQTISGRKRWFPTLRGNSRLSFREREALLREAVNMPIQGSAADIVKRAMIDVYEKIVKNSQADIALLLQIHDDLLFEIQEGLVSSAVSRIRDIMENAVTLSVPLKVEVKKGKRWGELTKLKV